MTTRIVSLRLPQKLVDQADGLAKETGVSRSRLVQLLLEKALATHDDWRDAQRLDERAKFPFHWKRQRR